MLLGTTGVLESQDFVQHLSRTQDSDRVHPDWGRMNKTNLWPNHAMLKHFP